MCSGKLVRLDNADTVFPHLLKRMDALALVQDHSGKIAQDLKEVEGRLSEKMVLLEKNQAVYEQEPSAFVAKVISRITDEVAKLEQDREQLQGELATEKISNWQDFMKRMDSLLVTTEGRLRANALLRRLKVVVYIGRRGVSEEGYYVTENDQSVFVLAQRDGDVGCLTFDDAGTYDKAAAAVAIDGLLGRMARKQKFIAA
jgi:hypothetical protein